MRSPRRALAGADRAGVVALGLLLGACTGELGEVSGEATGTAGPTGSTSTGAGVGGGDGGDGGEGEIGQGGGGGEIDPFVPEPIPDVGDEPAPACEAALSGFSFQFQHDVCKAKRWPVDHDRARPCRVVDSWPPVSQPSGLASDYAPAGEPPVLDAGALVGVVPDAMRVTVILVKRVGGVPHYRYLSNGSHHTAFQPWSTTKFLAAANAAATLRAASQQKVGLSAAISGVPLGDYVTSLHNYDYSPYSSNALGRYFHNIGGRTKANALIHEAWLGRPAGETFGGNYGEVHPALGYTFVAPGGASVTVSPDTSFGYANHLSSFTLAEALKRLALHREDPTTRLPSIAWEDIETLFFGAEGSAKYGARGGMTADPTLHMQQHDIDYLEARSHGQWLTLAKLGTGSEGQFVATSYGCFPVLDDEGEPVADWGREIVMSAQLPTGGATWRERDRIFARAHRAILKRVIAGEL